MATGVLVACLRVLDVQKLLLGGCRSTVYHAQEPSLLLMQAKNLAWCPLMLFSVTQSIQRHSSGEEM